MEKEISTMKKLVSFLLALVLVLSSVSALAAYNDHTDYVDWPIVKDGEKLTVSVATKRSEQYGKDPDQQWFWIWSETYSGIDFEVDQILSTAVDERKSLMFASGDLPDLLSASIWTPPSWFATAWAKACCWI